MENYFDLDLESLKTDFKDFVKNNGTLLKDYNFEGSALNELVGLLAYVTQYNMFYLNMVSNELFMNSAKMTNSVYKLAHMLNYLPKRNIAPSIVVNAHNTGATVTVSRGNQFLSGEISLIYLGDEQVVIGTGQTKSLTLHEGAWNVDTYVADGSRFQSFPLSARETVDNSFLEVFVDGEKWQAANVVNPVSGGKQYYYVECLEELRVKFDSGDLFDSPVGTVEIKYLVTGGSKHNSAIAAGATVGKYNSNALTLTATTALSGGSDYENIEDVKTRAVGFYVTQNRAVSEADYNIVMQKYPGFDGLADAYIWGGDREFVTNISTVSAKITDNTAEANDVGYVYISTMKKTDVDGVFEYLTDEDKDAIRDFFAPYKVITIFYRFHSPNVIYIEPSFRIKLAANYGVDLPTLQTKINSYLYGRYLGHNKSFNKSNVLTYVDSLNEVAFSDFDYRTYVKVCLEDDYEVVRLNGEVGGITGKLFDMGTVSSTVAEGATISVGANVAKVIDANGHAAGERLYVSVDVVSGTFASTGVGATIDTGSATFAATISAINNLSVSGSDLMLAAVGGASTTIGQINTTTGFAYIDVKAHLLQYMDSFSFYFDYTDDIGFDTIRESMMCPVAGKYEYI